MTGHPLAAAALGWKTGHAPGLSTVDGEIKTWPNGHGNKPDAAGVAAIVAEYEAAADGLAADTMRAAIVATDADMARVAEDLIDVLISGGVIVADDLPSGARAKVNARRALRGQVAL